jgi:hypothetical protein
LELSITDYLVAAMLLTAHRHIANHVMWHHYFATTYNICITPVIHGTNLLTGIHKTGHNRIDTPPEIPEIYLEGGTMAEHNSMTVLKGDSWNINISSFISWLCFLV